MNSRSHLMRRVILHGELLVTAFLLGFVPMWLKLRECSIGFPGPCQDPEQPGIGSI